MHTKGIYVLEINGKKYIGKDCAIDKNTRYNTHLNLLKTNRHYNKHMQNAYNKYGYVKYSVLVSGDFTNAELSKLEIAYIDKYNTFKNGYNLTLGGEGMSGYVKSESSKEKVRQASANNNAMAKITREDFRRLVSLLVSGATNGEIAKEFGLHSRYVSLIRHKKRHVEWWSEYPDLDIPESKGRRRKLSDKQLSEISDLVTKSPMLNTEIAVAYGVDKSVISRLRTKYNN